MIEQAATSYSVFIGIVSIVSVEYIFEIKTVFVEVSVVEPFTVIKGGSVITIGKHPTPF